MTQFTHSYSQPSVIAKIPGTSTDVVIVCAHFDSTAGSSTARSPGADDNASGVVVIWEALRVLAEAGFQPKDTLEFHFYAGEEGGLLGSASIMANYKAAAKNVLAVVNQDMAGYSPSKKISVYTDYVDASLTSYVRIAAAYYSGATTTSDTCGYGCSDHASATANGFRRFPRPLLSREPRALADLSAAAAYVCDEPVDTMSPYIHTPSDVSDKKTRDPREHWNPTLTCDFRPTLRSNGTQLRDTPSSLLAFWLKRRTCRLVGLPHSHAN